MLGCSSAYEPIKPFPNILTPTEAVLKSTITDYDALTYAQGVKLVMAGRVSSLERGDLASTLATSGLASGAAIASAVGGPASAVAAIVAVGALISNISTTVNPAVRANALSEGNILVLQAESQYFLGIADAGITKISKRVITPWGARLVADINSAIAATNRTLIGLMPSASDISRISAAPVKAPVHSEWIPVRQAINAEK